MFVELRGLQSCTSAATPSSQHVSAAHRHDPSALPGSPSYLRRAPGNRPSSCMISATPPASSARTIWRPHGRTANRACFEEYWASSTTSTRCSVSFPDINKSRRSKVSRRRARTRIPACPNSRRRRPENNGLPHPPPRSFGATPRTAPRRTRPAGRGTADARTIEDGGRGNFGQGHDFLDLNDP